MKALGQTGSELIQCMRRLREVGVGIPIRIAAAPSIHR